MPILLTHTHTAFWDRTTLSSCDLTSYGTALHGERLNLHARQTLRSPIYHLEVGTVFYSTDDDIKADTVLGLHKIGQLVRVGLEFGLASTHPAGQTSPETSARKGVMRTDMSCPLSS